MQPVKQEEIEVLIANAKKPTSYSNFSYPLNTLDDRLFEILTYSIFRKRIGSGETSLKNHFDDVKLMQGVGEKGMDCILLEKNIVNGVVQCKKYAKNLSDELIIQELTKFIINYRLDETRFAEPKNFKYIISTSTGYTGKAIRLFENINQLDFIKKTYDFRTIIETLAKKYKSLETINLDEMVREVPILISSFKYEAILPADYNLWISSFPEIIDTFFEVRKVTDNSAVENKGNEIIRKIDEIFRGKDRESLDEFVEKYKKIAKEKLNVINFIGFDLHRNRQKPTEITLSDLFVQPSFLQRIDSESQKVKSVVNRELKITNVLKSDKNIVILGQPGAGKSLLIKHLIVQILLQNEDKLGIKQFTNAIPFRIELRKYNDHRDTKSIIQYLVEVLATEYQTNVSQSLLAKILSNQKTIIFFDGLDEIFNISHKMKVKEAIDLFCGLYPNAKCIVTSRFIGYHDIKFNPDHFDEFAILKFTPPQVEELVVKFYSSQIQNLDKRKLSIDTCLLQIKNDVDEELKSNPLILTLILILASNNIVIPDSKLEIYEACTNTLVDSIDSRGKDLKIEIAVKNKRATFAHLAYWQYESTSKAQLVSFDKSVKSIADFLIEKKEVIEYADADEKARKFLEYAEKRSIYFEDNFTHKTFLEYFTADYLFINYFTKSSDTAREKLVSVITSYLPNPFWYIVFELLFSRIDTLQADNEVLDNIFNKQLKSDSLNVFYFFISNISNLSNISNSVKKEVIIKTIGLCIKGGKVTEIRRGFDFEDNSLILKLNKLQKNEETFDLLQQAIFHVENSKLSDKDAIEFYNLFHEIKSLNYKTGVTKQLKIQNLEKQEKLSLKDLLLFSQIKIEGYKNGEVLNVDILVEQIEHFGTKSIFTDVPFKYRENVIRIDSFDLYLMSVIEKCDPKTFKKDHSTLVENGIKHSNMMAHVKKSRMSFFVKGEGFTKILKLFLVCEDKKIDELLLCFVNKDVELKNTYLKFKRENKHSKLKILDKLFEI